MVKAIHDYSMLEDGDRVMVCTSGGKDSTIMLLLFQEIKKRARFAFDFDAVLLDQKQPGFNVDAYREFLGEQGIPLTVITEDTYNIVQEKVEVGKSFCGLCSRLRRGILYNYAHAHGFTKLALGHHRDDLNETVLLNLFYSGRIASMPPKLFSDDGRNVVIRPLCYIAEDWLQNYAVELEIPVIPCNLCGSQENLKRQKIKSLLANLEKEHPGIRSSLLTAQQNVRPSQMADQSLFDFHRS